MFFPRTSSCVPCRQSLTRATALQSATATPRRLLCCYCYTSTAVLLMLVLLLLLAHAARNPPQATSVCLLRSTIWRFSVAVVGRRRQNTGTPYLQLPLLVTLKDIASFFAEIHKYKNTCTTRDSYAVPQSMRDDISRVLVLVPVLALVLVLLASGTS